MSGMSKETLEAIAAVADDLPEKYQVAAFQELVRYELSGRSQADGRAGGNSDEEGDSGSPTVHHDRPSWFEKVLEQMPDMDVFESGGRDAQAAWALVELYRRGEEATVASARNLIKDELGVSPESRPHMSNRLGKDFTPKYATRVKDGRGYRYEPTVKIAEKFPKPVE
jgi:hypothetical protein